MSSPTKLPANRFVFARIRKLKFSFADRTRQDLHCVSCAVESEGVHRVGAGDAKMNRNSGGNKNAMGNEQVLLRDHAHGDRAIRILFRAKIILDELPRKVKR